MTLSVAGTEPRAVSVTGAVVVAVMVVVKLMHDLCETLLCSFTGEVPLEIIEGLLVDIISMSSALAQLNQYV